MKTVKVMVAFAAMLTVLFTVQSEVGRAEQPFLATETGSDLSVLASPQDDPDDVFWSPLDSVGTNNVVYALTVYGNKLIAGGLFTLAGGDTVNYIAAWDGVSWSPLGSGMNGTVYALTVYDNKLIAGGASRLPVVTRLTTSPLGTESPGRRLVPG